jgi:hypothetical protein
MQSVDMGALTSLYAATAPEAAELNGKVCRPGLVMVDDNHIILIRDPCSVTIQYFGPWARLRPTRSDMDDITKQEELWAWLETQVKEHAGA